MFKTMKNDQKYRNIRLANNGKRNYLVSEANCYSSKWFSEKLIAIDERN